MKYTDHHTVEDLKIAYVGGGSQGWAWGLMSDLAAAGDLSGVSATKTQTNSSASKSPEGVCPIKKAG